MIKCVDCKFSKQVRNASKGIHECIIALPPHFKKEELRRVYDYRGW